MCDKEQPGERGWDACAPQPAEAASLCQDDYEKWVGTHANGGTAGTQLGAALGTALPHSLIYNGWWCSLRQHRSLSISLIYGWGNTEKQTWDHLIENIHCSRFHLGTKLCIFCA